METTATLNPILTDVANAFMRDPKGFVANIICPPFLAPLQAGTYYKFDVEDIADVPVLKPRAPGSVFHRFQTKVTSDSYNCENYGLEAPVPDEEAKKYASYFDLEKVKVSRIVDTIRVNTELRVKALVATLTSANIALAWNQPASNPRTDVNAACEVIRQQSGTPRSMVTMTINQPTLFALQQHPLIRDQVKYTSSATPTEMILAMFFGVRRVVVAYNVQAINHEGQAFSASDIWDNKAAFTVDVDASDLETPCCLRSFRWSAFTDVVSTLDSGGAPATGTGGGQQTIFTYRDENVKSFIQRGEHFVAEKVVAAGCGYVLNNCLQ